MAVVKQLAYLYDSTGLIEKHNRIYFNPFNVTTATQWFSAFDNKAGKSGFYYGIELTGWSPEDRVLKVKGQIDDFRDYVTGALILNYLIVKRLDENNNVKAYVSFFVESVRQAGVGSVELSLTPDHFTNTFFFNVQGADPFNQTIKNAYVERQHYDRVKYYSEEVTITDVNQLGGDVEYNVVPQTLYSGLPLRVTFPVVYNLVIGNEDLYIVIKYNNEIVFEGNAKYMAFAKQDSPSPLDPHTELRVLLSDDSDLSTQKYTHSWRSENISNLKITFKLNPNKSITTDTYTSALLSAIDYSFYLGYDNLELFANTPEDNFNFRYQYKDMKKQLDLTSTISYFTDDELSIIDSTPAINFSSIPQSIRDKMLRASLQWYIIQCKETVTLPMSLYLGETIGNRKQTNQIVWSLTKDLKRGTDIQYLTLPVMVVPEFLSKFRYSLEQFVLCPRVYYYNIGTLAGGYYLNRITSGYYAGSYQLNNCPIADFARFYGAYIQSIYLIHDATLNDRLTFDYGNNLVILKSLTNYNEIPDYEIESYHLGFQLFCTNEELIANYVGKKHDFTYYQVEYDTSGGVGSFYNNTHDTAVFPIFSIGRLDVLRCNLIISNTIPDVKSSYFDTLLTFEPYNYYTISFAQSMEVPLDKKRYYQSYSNQNFNIDFDYIFSLSGVLKLGLFIKYDVNNFSTRYYGDSLIISSSATLPFVSDSYYSYIYQNMALMNAQYNLTYNRGLVKGLDHSLNTMPASIASSYLSSGTYGMAAEMIDQASSIVSENIDLNQSLYSISETQKAQKAGAGSRPDTIKQSNSDLLFNVMIDENQFYLNHYDIDTLSKNTICKYLERFGYKVDLFDTLNIDNRKGWNYIKLIAFDIEKPVSIEQENEIRTILKSGVTLLHNPEYLRDDSYHNYEVSLDE